MCTPCTTVYHAQDMQAISKQPVAAAAPADGRGIAFDSAFGSRSGGGAIDGYRTRADGAGVASRVRPDA